MMIGTLSAQGSSFSHCNEATQGARESLNEVDICETERRRNSSCRFPQPPLRKVTWVACFKSLGLRALIGNCFWPSGALARSLTDRNQQATGTTLQEQ